MAININAVPHPPILPNYIEGDGAIFIKNLRDYLNRLAVASEQTIDVIKEQDSSKPSGGYGDMLKSEFDKDGDGVVDQAKEAQQVSWNNISGRPDSFPVSDHTHVLKDITDLPSFRNNALKVLRVNASETGIEYGSVGGTGATTIEELSDVQVTMPDDGHVLMFNTTTMKWENEVLPEVSNVFTMLSDAPQSYTGNAGKIVAVKGDETGLEFIVPSSSGGSSSDGGFVAAAGIMLFAANCQTFVSLTDLDITKVRRGLLECSVAENTKFDVLDYPELYIALGTNVLPYKQIQNDLPMLIVANKVLSSKLGTLAFYPANKTIPTGFLSCSVSDGQTFDETAYPDLYKYLGTNTLVYIYETTDNIVIINATQDLYDKTGFQVLFPNDTPIPTGFLSCSVADGTTFDKDKYPKLYDLLGTDILPYYPPVDYIVIINANGRA